MKKTLLLPLTLALTAAAILLLSARRAPEPVATKPPAPTEAALPLAAVDWPQYRGGPELRGVAEGKLAAKLDLLWSFKTGGSVESSPLVHEGRVLFGSDEPMFYALDAKTGKQVWKFPIGDKMP